MRKIASKTAKAVIDELSNLEGDFGDKFTQVFKNITSDNGLEFADFHKLELQ